MITYKVLGTDVNCIMAIFGTDETFNNNIDFT